MVTRLADIIVPSVFNPYVIERTKEKSALFQSGIIAENDEMNRLASGGGSTVNMPFFNDLTGDSQVLSDTNPLSVSKITSAQDVAVKHFRGNAWGSNDLAQALSGADPMGAIGDLVADWWMRDQQRMLIASLRGIFAASSMSNNVHNISIEAGNSATAANRISAEATIAAFAKLGDETEALTAIAMHSVLYWSLVQQDLIEFEQPSTQGQPIQRYLGRRVIVDDGCPVVAGTTNGFKYTSFLFGAGSIGYGEANIDEATETDRDILAGNDYLTNRRHFILHPRGVRWQGTPAGTSPTNTELQTGGNWLRVYPVKNVRIIALTTNG